MLRGPLISVLTALTLCSGVGCAGLDRSEPAPLAPRESSAPVAAPSPTLGPVDLALPMVANSPWLDGGASEGANDAPAIDPPRRFPRERAAARNYSPVGNDGDRGEESPRFVAVIPSTLRRTELTLDYKIEGARTLIERVELWVTSDAGGTWRLHAYDADCHSPITVQFEDGDWGLWWVVTTEGGRGPYPRPGDPPPETISVDTRPPTVTFAPSRVWALSHAVIGDRIGIELPFQVDDPHLDVRSIRAESKVGRGDWRLIDPNDGVARVDVPVGPDPVRIRISARDHFGHAGSLETTILPTDRLDPPRVAFVDAPKHWVGGGRTVQLSWEGHWPSSPEATATIEFSFDGVEWQPVARGLPQTGVRSWRVPRTGTRTGQLRVRLVGNAARVDSPSESRAVRIDAVPPVARLVAPSAGEGSQIPLLVETGDSGGSELAVLELWRHTEGQWRLAGSFEPANAVPFDPPAPGEYRLWLVARDGSGLESEPPPAEPALAFHFTARGEERQIRLLSFREGGFFPAGGRHLVFFEYSGGAAETTLVHLEWSPDDGRTWSRRGTVPAREGRIDLVLPTVEVPTARVRVVAVDVAGRRSEDRSPQSFRVVTEAPALAVTRVMPTREGGSEVHFRTDGDRLTTVEKVILYHRDDRGRWQRWPGAFAPRSPLLIDLPATTSFELAAVDRAGNETLGPHAGELRIPEPDPRQMLPAGTLSWLTEGGRTVVGGSSHYLFWRTEGSGPAPTARLEQRIGTRGTWFEIARDLPGTGRHLWLAPQEDGAEVWLRLVTQGNQGEVITEIAAPFTVDDRTPRAYFSGPESSRSRVTTFEVKAPADEDVDRVQVWARHASTPEWRQVAEARPGERLQAELVDGLYHVAAVAVDGAGNRSARPVAGAKGQGTLLIDTVPPILQVDESEERKRLFRRNGRWVVRPRAHDANLSAFPISFQVIEDGSITPTSLQSYHPNATDFEWTLPARAGVHTLEVIAEDLAGNRAVQRIPVTVIPTPPRPVLLTDFAERVLAAGDEVSLEWETEGVEPDLRALSVQFTIDGENYRPLHDALAVDGSIVWRVPSVDSNRCRIRLQVVAPDGLRGEVISERFTVSSSPPRVRAGGIRPAGER